MEDLVNGTDDWDPNRILALFKQLTVWFATEVPNRLLPPAKRHYQGLEALIRMQTLHFLSKVLHLLGYPRRQISPLYLILCSLAADNID